MKGLLWLPTLPASASHMLGCCGSLTGFNKQGKAILLLLQSALQTHLHLWKSCCLQVHIQLNWLNRWLFKHYRRQTHTWILKCLMNFLYWFILSIHLSGQHRQFKLWLWPCSACTVVYEGCDFINSTKLAHLFSLFHSLRFHLCRCSQ